MIMGTFTVTAAMAERSEGSLRMITRGPRNDLQEFRQDPGPDDHGGQKKAN